MMTKKELMKEYVNLRYYYQVLLAYTVFHNNHRELSVKKERVVMNELLPLWKEFCEGANVDQPDQLWFREWCVYLHIELRRLKLLQVINKTKNNK